MKLKKRAIIESLDSVANLYSKEMEAEAALLILGNALQLNRAAEAVKSELKEETKDRNRQDFGRNHGSAHSYGGCAEDGVQGEACGDA